MRIGICSPNRLFREALARAIASDLYCLADTAESVRQLALDQDAAPPDLLILDGPTLAAEDVDILMGAILLGQVVPIVLGDPAAECPGIERVLPPDASIDDLIEQLSLLTQPERTRPRIPRNCDNPFALTAREYEVGMLVAAGLSNARIAERLNLKEQSVKNLVNVIQHKLRLENRVQIALKLLEGRVSGADSDDLP